jgi:hypothetical protein
VQPFADDLGALLTAVRPRLREDVVDNVIALNAERVLDDLGGSAAVIGVDCLFEKVGYACTPPG